MSDFLLPSLQGLEPYVPGEQPRDGQYVKLNTNESPYPPSPRALSALSREEASRLNLYSDPTLDPLKLAIAEHYGLAIEQVFAGNGSDEVLAFAFMAYADGAHPVTMPDISYGLYPIHARLFGAKPLTVPLNEDYSMPVEPFMGAQGMAAFASPNAPTGIALTTDDIERVLKGNPDNVVLVDEAYADFAEQSAVPLLSKYPNLLIVRTFSKSRSLAGARLGYALASPELIGDLERVRGSFHPYNINRLSMLAGVEAMRDEAYFRECVAGIKRQREQSAAELRRMGFALTDSQANFLFASHPRLTGREIYDGLRERGILVRYFDAPRLRRHARISIGTRAQMDALVSALMNILAEVER